MTNLAVLPVPAFDDNYLWLVPAPGAPGLAVVVDPGDAAPVQAELDRRGLRLAAILVTHHHGDHVGGLAELVANAGGVSALPVYGPADEDIEGITHPVKDGDTVALPALGLHFDVLSVPGHTRGHLAYAGHGVVFCGDTMFSGGCGRLFEGTPAQMHRSLGRLAALPPQTQVFCAHEYTASNLRFALAVEPGNAALQAYAAEVTTRRAAGLPTVPSTIGRELAINPFVRTQVAEVRAAASAHAAHAGLPAVTDDVSTLAALREWKNGFRG